MALLERLQILIDADAKGAMREFEKAGASADKLDAKLEKGSAKTSARLTSIGTKAALGGVAVLGGLAKLATMSDEAEKQQMKLQNSIKNSNQAFSNGGKGLTDLAQGLQQVTAADGDAIVGAESLLVQMGLTQAQVKQITPLVVDLSRKMGIGLDQAAKVAGKAIGGNAGALKKLGIDVDATALKADGFGTTMQALAGSVGGFAREEGKTFSGQIAILKNNLGDLGETVGKGAASVFAGLASDANGVVGALNKLNPAIGTSIGALGAAGGVTATLAGGFAFAGGKMLQFTNSIRTGESALVKLGENGEKSLSGLGKATAVVGTVVAVTALTEALFGIINEANGMQDRFSMAWDGIRKGAVGTSGDITKAFESLAKANDDALTWGHLITSWGDNIKLGNVNVEIEDAQKAFSDLLDTVGPEAASKVIQGLKAQNAELDKNSRQYKTNADFIAKNERAVKQRKDAIKAATIAEREQKRATEQSVQEYDRYSNTVDGVNQTIKDYNDRLRLLTSSYDGAQAGAKAFADQMNRAAPGEGFGKAVADLSNKFRTLGDDLKGLPSFADSLDPTKISEQGAKAIDSFYGVADQIKTTLQAAIAAGSPNAEAIAKTYRDNLVKGLLNNGVSGADVQRFLQNSGLTDQQITVAVKFATNQASLEQLKLDLELFQTDLDKDPNAVLFVKTAVANGDLAGALAFIQAWLTQHPVTVPTIPAAPGDGSNQGPPGNVGAHQGRVPDNNTGTPGHSSTTVPGNGRDRSGRRRGAPPGEAPSPPNASYHALGGPMAVGDRSYVNERGAEMWVPSTSGFVMNASESKRLVAGVEAMLAGGGGHTFNITSTDPMLSAAEVVRRQRDSQFLLGR